MLTEIKTLNDAIVFDVQGYAEIRSSGPRNHVSCSLEFAKEEHEKALRELSLTLSVDQLEVSEVLGSISVPDREWLRQTIDHQEDTDGTMSRIRVRLSPESRELASNLARADRHIQILQWRDDWLIEYNKKVELTAPHNSSHCPQHYLDSAGEVLGAMRELFEKGLTIVREGLVDGGDWKALAELDEDLKSSLASGWHDKGRHKFFRAEGGSILYMPGRGTNGMRNRLLLRHVDIPLADSSCPIRLYHTEVLREEALE